MFAVLYVDGEPIGLSSDSPEAVSLEFDADAALTHRCRACGEELTQTVDGYENESDGAVCSDFEPISDTDPDYGHGPHDPERIPLSWCNSAAVHTDESEDSVTVSISVGDPRGAFTFTIRRVPDDVDSDLAGHLIMHTPYPSEPAPHMDLTPLHDGTYVVGHYMPARRMRSVPPAA
ncbi:hypothetical protein LWC34_30280 [Kibdelosporangium philippinense]|uniref:Uncharacterized protein n=1 Tax=Kibdelosporangium philippinense TaxID=211113 RepID=A0ABS8ZGY6_9PSEU|nr:hypothetical protein [Kibdelosporangium philippinense]MCE7007084.1 hypothetical protein [Kibdelosporangium philippinense]